MIRRFGVSRLLVASLCLFVSLFCLACSEDNEEDHETLSDGDTGDEDGDEPIDGDEDGDDPSDGDEEAELIDSGVRLRGEGWLRGDLHMHTTWSDGYDSVAMVISIAEYLEDPTFLAAHPEYEGNGLDFISITDHRCVDSVSDPEWTSDRLILIPGQEFGGDGHANIWGVTEFVPHDPGGDGTTLADIEAAIETANNAGGVFSINHPKDSGNSWPWDTRTHGSLEICNVRWGTGEAPFSEEVLAEWEEDHGIPASPMFKKALEEEQGQMLRFYEAMLAREMRIAVVGGSDRHGFFMIGYPTTWVKPDGEDYPGVVNGIRNRNTFISRSPVAATVEMTVDPQSGEIYEMGDDIPIGATGTSVEITLRVGRAEGGIVRLMRGSSVETDEQLMDATLGEVFAEMAIDSQDMTVTLSDVAVMPGDWFYPVVLDSLYVPGLTDEQKLAVDDISTGALAIGGENFVAFAGLFIDYMDMGVFADPTKCDPTEWNPEHLQCLPIQIGEEATTTFFVPDWIDRALNAFQDSEGGETWSMGAIGSATRFVE